MLAYSWIPFPEGRLTVVNAATPSSAGAISARQPPVLHSEDPLAHLEILPNSPTIWEQENCDLGHIRNLGHFVLFFPEENIPFLFLSLLCNLFFCLLFAHFLKTIMTWPYLSRALMGLHSRKNTITDFYIAWFITEIRFHFKRLEFSFLFLAK